MYFPYNVSERKSTEQQSEEGLDKLLLTFTLCNIMRYNIKRK